MIPLRDISPEDLQTYLKKHQKDTGYERILGFRPTGWTCAAASPFVQSIAEASLADISFPPPY